MWGRCFISDAVDRPALADRLDGTPHVNGLVRQGDVDGLHGSYDALRRRDVHLGQCSGMTPEVSGQLERGQREPAVKGPMSCSVPSRATQALPPSPFGSSGGTCCGGVQLGTVPPRHVPVTIIAPPFGAKSIT